MCPGAGTMRKRWPHIHGLSVVGLISVWVIQPCMAGELRVRLPDDRLRYLIDKTCNYDSPLTGQGHCEADRNGGQKDSGAKADWFLRNWVQPVVDTAIRYGPRAADHQVQSLADLGGSLSVCYDTPPADWPANGDGKVVGCR